MPTARSACSIVASWSCSSSRWRRSLRRHSRSPAAAASVSSSRACAASPRSASRSAARTAVAGSPALAASTAPPRSPRRWRTTARLRQAAAAVAGWPVAGRKQSSERQLSPSSAIRAPRSIAALAASSGSASSMTRR
ncbi:hypothetical protein ACFQ0B_70595 [Nonomuraea thailandensis]